MRESAIERYLVKRMNEIGAICLKMVPTYHAGLPDRLVLYEGTTTFVELKAPGKKPTKLQLTFTDELKAAGHVAVVIDSKEAVDEFVGIITTYYFSHLEPDRNGIYHVFCRSGQKPKRNNIVKIHTLCTAPIPYDSNQTDRFTLEELDTLQKVLRDPAHKSRLNSVFRGGLNDYLCEHANS